MKEGGSEGRPQGKPDGREDGRSEGDGEAVPRQSSVAAMRTVPIMLGLVIRLRVIFDSR